MKTLHLPIKKEWLDMILSGEKVEEYREIKEHWTSRIEGKHFDVVCLRNGYKKDAPKVTLRLIDIDQGYGTLAWGAPKDEKVYILYLGEIIDKQNI